jgi:hypothetical protein
MYSSYLDIGFQEEFFFSENRQNHVHNIASRWLAPVIIVGYVLFTPVCIFLAKKNPATEKVY